MEPESQELRSAKSVEQLRDVGRTSMDRGAAHATAGELAAAVAAYREAAIAYRRAEGATRGELLDVASRADRTGGRDRRLLEATEEWIRRHCTPAQVYGDALLTALRTDPAPGLSPAAYGMPEPLRAPDIDLIGWMRAHPDHPAIARFGAAVHRYFDGTPQRTAPAYAMGIFESLAAGAPDRWSTELQSSPCVAVAFRGLWEAFRSSGGADR